jgi:hypothetical protein
MLATDLESQQVTFTDTIAAGEALSTGVDFAGFTPIGFFSAAAWTAATLSFQTSLDGSTWVDITTTNGSIQPSGVLTTPNTYHPIGNYFGMIVPGSWPRRVRLRSQTAGVNVNQAAERVFTWLASPNILRKA